MRLETICLNPFSDKLGDSYVVSGGRHRIQPAVRFLTALTPGGSTDFLGVVREFLSRYPQRGVTFVISDFLDDNDCEKPLQYLADFGHELILVQVWSEADREPPWDGELELEDAESGRVVKLPFGSDVRAAYAAVRSLFGGPAQRGAAQRRAVCWVIDGGRNRRRDLRPDHAYGRLAVTDRA